MGKKWLIALGIAAIWGGVVVAIAHFGSPGAGQKHAAGRPPIAEAPPRHEARPRHIERSQGAAAQAAPPNVGPTQQVAHVAEAPRGRGVAAREEHIAGLPEFKAFAARTSLKPDEERTIAHVLALHYENDAALVATAEDPEKLSQMKLRLITDTLAQLRARMTEPTWEAFLRTGLLVGIAPANGGT